MWDYRYVWYGRVNFGYIIFWRGKANMSNVWIHPNDVYSAHSCVAIKLYNSKVPILIGSAVVKLNDSMFHHPLSFRMLFWQIKQKSCSQWQWVKFCQISLNYHPHCSIFLSQLVLFLSALWPCNLYSPFGSLRNSSQRRAWQLLQGPEEWHVMTAMATRHQASYWTKGGVVSLNEIRSPRHNEEH